MRELFKLMSMLGITMTGFRLYVSGGINAGGSTGIRQDLAGREYYKNGVGQNVYVDGGMVPQDNIDVITARTTPLASIPSATDANYGSLYNNNGNYMQSRAGLDLNVGNMTQSEFTDWASTTDSAGNYINADAAAQMGGKAGLEFDAQGKSNLANPTDSDTFLGMGKAGWGTAVAGLNAGVGLASYLDQRKLWKKQGAALDENIAGAKAERTALANYRRAYGA